MKVDLIIERIDKNITTLLKHRDSEFVIQRPELRATVCNVIEKCYFLQSVILKNRRFSENNNDYFFTADSAVNRHFRDWGLDEVADIFNELRTFAIKYMDEKSEFLIMTKKEKYKYHFRPGYDSQFLLIEFFSEVENENFLNDLLNAISEINPKLKDYDEIWVNDEIILELDTDIGSFSLSKDIWGFAFIIADENQKGLEIINSILVKDLRFQKVEVSFDNYKTTTDS